MPYVAPNELNAHVLYLLGVLKHYGYQATRSNGHSVMVRTGSDSAYFCLSVMYRHPRRLRDSRTTTHPVVVRIEGRFRAAGSEQVVRRTVPIWDGGTAIMTTFRAVWDRVLAACDALQEPMPEVTTSPKAEAQVLKSIVLEAEEAIRALDVPLPRVHVHKPGYVLLRYDHGEVRCRVENAGTTAFALWALRD